MTSPTRGSSNSQDTEVIPSSQSTAMNSQTHILTMAEALEQAREKKKLDPVPPYRQESVIPIPPWTQDVTTSQNDSQSSWVPSSQTQELLMSPVSCKSKERAFGFGSGAPDDWNAIAKAARESGELKPQPAIHRSSDGAPDESDDQSVVPTSQPWADKGFAFMGEGPAEGSAVKHNPHVVLEREVHDTVPSREPPRTPSSDRKHIRYIYFSSPIAYASCIQSSIQQWSRPTEPTYKPCWYATVTERERSTTHVLATRASIFARPS